MCEFVGKTCPFVRKTAQNKGNHGKIGYIKAKTGKTIVKRYQPADPAPQQSIIVIEPGSSSSIQKAGFP